MTFVARTITLYLTAAEANDAATQGLQVVVAAKLQAGDYNDEQFTQPTPSPVQPTG